MPKGPVTLYGPFHRLAGRRSQTPAVAQMMVESGELWGRAPKQGGSATAQAWRGPFPRDAKPGSVEFYTTVKPRAYDRSLTGQAAWEAEREPDVRSFEKDGDEWASIPIIITEAR